MACMRVAKQLKTWEVLDTMWLGTFCRPKHHLVVKQKKSNNWYFAVLNFKDSAVLMHRAKYERLSVNGKTYHTWSPMVPGEGPTIKPVWDYTDYEVFLCYM